MLTAEQQAVAEEYLDLCETEAWNFAVRSGGKMSVDDCRSAALLGLTQAIDSWPRYLAKHPDYDPGRLDYRRAYILKRVRGSILDLARSSDHMTRSARSRIKAIRVAEDDGHRGEVAVAKATGLSVAMVRRLEADALVAVSLDDQSALTGGADYAGPAVTDHAADTESQTVVSELLKSFTASFNALDPEVQVVLAMRFHLEYDFTKISELLRTSTKRITELHDAGVCAVHRALLAQVDSGPLVAARPGLLCSGRGRCWHSAVQRLNNSWRGKMFACTRPWPPGNCNGGVCTGGPGEKPGRTAGPEEFARLMKKKRELLLVH